MASTINDIAKLVGVSHSCVSRVLNNAPIRVSKTTREKIFEAAKQLNYIPNLSAKALRTGKHCTISVIAYDITDAFAIECMSSLEKEALTSPYRILWTSCAYQKLKKIKPMETLNEVSQFSDGIIILAAGRYLQDEDIIKFWGKTQIPIVTILRTIPGNIISSITINEEIGAEALVNHLIKLGHKKIAFCYGLGENASGQRRYEVYRKLMDKHKLHPEKHFQLKVDGTSSGGFQAGLQLLKAKERPDAIIAFNDLTAIGLIKACYDNNVIVPDEISISSFDNIRIAEMTTPSLTTVAVDFQQLIHLSFSELLRRINKNIQHDDSIKQFTIKPELIIRDSTKRVL